MANKSESTAPADASCWNEIAQRSSVFIVWPLQAYLLFDRHTHSRAATHRFSSFPARIHSGLRRLLFARVYRTASTNCRKCVECSPMVMQCADAFASSQTHKPHSLVQPKGNFICVAAFGSTCLPTINKYTTMGRADGKALGSVVLLFRI